MDYEAVIKHLESRISTMEYTIGRMSLELDRVRDIAVTAAEAIDNHEMCVPHESL